MPNPLLKADDEFELDDDEMSWEAEAEKGRRSGCTPVNICLPMSAETVPNDAFENAMGMCGDSRFIGGIWYRPGRGTNLWRAAREARRRLGGRMSLIDYINYVTVHPANECFRSRRGRGWPTRAFLPRWSRDGRTHVGRGGRYGLIFFPVEPRPPTVLPPNL